VDIESRAKWRVVNEEIEMPIISKRSILVYEWPSIDPCNILKFTTMLFNIDSVMIYFKIQWSKTIDKRLA